MTETKDLTCGKCHKVFTQRQSFHGHKQVYASITIVKIVSV